MGKEAYIDNNGALRSCNRFGKSRLEWTADKILKGAGPGADPTEVDMPGGIPSGVIMIWHGTIVTIPDGYLICDGNNSTPNLLTRFIQGVATAGTNPGAVGGATAKVTAGHTTPAHTLTEGEMPSHTHSVPGDTAEGTAMGINDVAAGTLDNPVTSGAKGGGGGHTHSLQTDSIADIRPLFYDIAFIMKS